MFYFILFFLFIRLEFVKLAFLCALVRFCFVGKFTRSGYMLLLFLSLASLVTRTV